MHNYDQYPELGTIRKFEKKAISDALAITLLHVLLQPRHPSSRPSGGYRCPWPICCWPASAATISLMTAIAFVAAVCVAVSGDSYNKATENNMVSKARWANTIGNRSELRASNNKLLRASSIFI